MLVLFDVDGTLLLSGGQGAKAMQEAGRRLFGDGFSLREVAFAGNIDPLILQDGLRRAGIEARFEVDHDAFRATYARCLARRLAGENTTRPLPGVLPLLERLRGRADLTLGLLTGNYPETGRIKLEAAGIDPSWFPVPVWGVDGPTRRDLPPVAMDRYAALFGRVVSPERVVVVGDTVHDIDCARHNGCLALAVASGPAYDREALAAHDPELLVDSLEDTDAIVGWLLNRGARDGAPRASRT